MKTILILFTLFTLFSCRKSPPITPPPPAAPSNTFEDEGVTIIPDDVSALYWKAGNMLTVYIKCCTTGTQVQEIEIWHEFPSVGTFVISDWSYYQGKDIAIGYTRGTEDSRGNRTVKTYNTLYCDAANNPGVTGYQKGQLKISKLDTTNKKVSVEFYFDLCGASIPQDHYIKIRKGNFADIPLHIQ